MLHFMRGVLFYTKCSKTISLLGCCRFHSVNASKIIRSVVPNISVPEVFLDDYIWQKLDKWDNKTAMQCGETGRKYSYSEIYKKSGALCNYLLTKMPNLKRNDTLAIILPNVPEYPIIMLGVIKAGLKITTVNSYYKSDEIYKQLLNSETKFVFTSSQLWPEVKHALQRLNANIPVAIIKQTQAESLPEGTMCLAEILQTQFEAKLPSYKRSVEDIVILPYSSGTTGLPKGVALTHKNIVANLCQMKTPPFKLIADTEGSYQETLPAILHLHHIYGMVELLLNGLKSGSKLVTLTKFSPEGFINVLKQYKPTMAYLSAPTLLFLINSKNVPQELIRQMKSIIFSAAPLGAADINRLRGKYAGNTNFLQTYGSTETCSISHSQTAAIQNGVINGGTGLALPNTECAIVASNSEETTGGTNITGELYIRGPQVMKGYFQNDVATRSVIDPEGWFKTGDFAHFDQNGHLFVTDRVNDIIKVKGALVAPSELEEVLRRYHCVEDAAVIAWPDDHYGEVPKAFVVPKPNVKIDPLKIEKFVAVNVDHHKKIRGGVCVVGSIPKSTSGKILRRELRMI